MQQQAVFMFLMCMILHTQAYKLAVQWPPGVCFGRRACSGGIIRFTVHGLWPDGPPPPCPTPYKNIQYLNLRQWMEFIWPNLLGKSDRFWDHEWDKHGCQTNLTQDAYFYTTIELYNRLNIDVKIYNSSIKPGQSYNLTTLLKTMKRVADNHDVELTCKRDGDQYILTEVRICYTEVEGLPGAIENCLSTSKTCGGETTQVLFPMSRSSPMDLSIGAWGGGILMIICLVIGYLLST